jgi:hypothetical protein
MSTINFGTVTAMPCLSIPDLSAGEYVAFGAKFGCNWVFTLRPGGYLMYPCRVPLTAQSIHNPAFIAL